jgi:RNA polymerase sigma-70 factor (ECF subfamily)
MAATQHVEDWIPTRQSLLSRLRNWDDRASWEDFFNTYWRLVYNVALKAGLTGAEAQDVVQETVITVARQMPEFQYDPGKGSFKGWLLKTTQWRINDQFRKRQPGVPMEDQPDTATEQTPKGSGREQLRVEALGVETHWDELWETHVLEAAIERVKRRADPREFQIFDLTVNRGMAPQKAAKKLNVMRAHVYYAKHKIARMIRREMERLERC